MAAGGGRGAMSRLAARLSWALLKRERMGVDELGNVYYRWGGVAALQGAWPCEQRAPLLCSTQ